MAIWQRRSRGISAQVIEPPQVIGERYWRELKELVDQGEISSDFAVRIMRDMFEEGAPGEPRKLRGSFWRAYVKEITGDYS